MACLQTTPWGRYWVRIGGGMRPHTTGTDGARSRRARHFVDDCSRVVRPKVRGGGFGCAPHRCHALGVWCSFGVGSTARKSEGPDLRSCVDPGLVICRECCERTVSRFINRVLFSGTQFERVGVLARPVGLSRGLDVVPHVLHEWNRSRAQA